MIQLVYTVMEVIGTDSFTRAAVARDLSHWRASRNKICHHHKAYLQFAGSFTVDSFSRALQVMKNHESIFRSYEGPKLAYDVASNFSITH